MAGDSQRLSAGRPRVAYVYHPSSFPTLSIAQAAAETCEVIWVVDTAIPGAQQMVRLLQRFGVVVDVTGMDRDAAVEAIGALSPDGLLTLSDDCLVWSAEVGSALGLPGPSPEVARRLVDKHAQRRALQEGGLAVPGFWLVPERDDAPGWGALEAAATFPAVLKPRQGEGSRNTFRVRSFAELSELVREADEDVDRRNKPLVLEEYLRDAAHQTPAGFAGYLSVESVVSHGQVSPVALTGRFPPAEPFRETGFFIPAALDDEQVQAVTKLAIQSAEAIGVTTGCLHTEIKLTPEGPRVIEVNGRLGGGIPEMLAIASGVDLYSMALRLALGERIVYEALVPCTRVGWLLYVQAPSSMRTVLGVEGLEELGRRPEVREVVLNRGPGQHVDWREGNHGHVYSVLGVARDHGHLLELEQQVHDQVIIRGA